MGDQTIGKMALLVTANSSSFTAETRKATDEAEKLAAGLQRQINELSLVDRSIEVYQLRLRGASDESVRRVETLQNELSALQSAAAAERDRAAATAAAERERQAVMAKGAAITASVRTQAERYREELASLRSLLKDGAISQETFNRAMLRVQQTRIALFSRNQAGGAGAGQANNLNGALLPVQQLAFGLQDAATVYSLTGFAGAVRASSNNVIQFASLIHPLAGTLAALAGTGLALWVDGMDRAAKEQAKLDEQTRRHEQSIRRVTDAIQAQGQAARDRQAIKDLTGVDELKAAQKRESGRAAEVRTERDAIETERNRLADEIKYLTNPKGEDLFGPVPDRFRHLPEDPEAQQEYIKTARKQKQELETMLQKHNAELERIARNRKEINDKLKEAELDKKALEQGKERLNGLAKYYEDLEKAAEDQQKQQEERKRLRRDILRDTPQGQAESIVDQVKQQLDELGKLGFGDDERKHLEDMLFQGADKQLLALHSKGKSTGALAGSAEFGTREAFDRVALASVGNSSSKLDENTRKIVENTRDQLKEMRKLRDAVKTTPLGIVSFN